MTEENLLKVTVRLHRDDLERVDKLASSEKVSRAEIIRQAVTASSHSSPLTQKPFTHHDYNRLVADAYHSSSCNLDHRQVESVVAFVITRLMGKDG